MKPGTGRRLLGGAVLALAGYWALWGGEYSAFDLGRLRRERERTGAELAAARARVDSLRALAGKLESDPATIERIARERFGMIREGETLYRLVPPADSAAPAAGGPGRP